MGSLSELGNDSDSDTRQTDDVREYESQRRDDFIDAEENKYVTNEDKNTLTVADENGTTDVLIECSKQKYKQHGDVFVEDCGDTADEFIMKSASNAEQSPDAKSDSKLKTHFERLSSDAIHVIDSQPLPSASFTSSTSMDNQKDLTLPTNYRHTSSLPNIAMIDKTIIDLNYIKKEVIEFPHRAVRVTECQVCFDKKCIRRRVCCDFQMCDDCLLEYVAGKVNDGKVQIECGNDRCKALMYKDEIRHRLPLEMKEKFNKFLIDANQDPYIKTCPSCSSPHRIDPARLNVSKKVLRHGVDVACPQCRVVWCFRCQAPFHSNMTCNQYMSEDDMLKRWAKQKNEDGKNNARKCPKCKIFVQKTGGCDHMECIECKTQFCYKCGGRYIKIKYVGSHEGRFSIFGCKYKMLPKRKALRQLIRGSVFVGRVCGGIVLCSIAVAAGAVLVAGSVVILPGYGIFRWRKRRH